MGTLILHFEHLISVKSKNIDPAVTVEAGQKHSVCKRKHRVYKFFHIMLLSSFKRI